MNLTFTVSDATLLLGFLTSVVIPIATALIVRPTTNPYLKLAIAIVLSGVGGFLSVYIAGDLHGSVIAVALAVFLAAQIHFGSWFKGTDLKARLEALFAGTEVPDERA